MLTNDDVIAALASAREAVRQGGLVVIELAHPCESPAHGCHSPSKPQAYKPFRER